MTAHNCSTQKKVPASKQNERLTLIVVVITLITMLVEIFAGIISGSMALLSDGIHMGTHSLALLITLAAYIFSRRHIDNPLYSFGTGKVGVLGGYTNAILLLMAAAAMVYESCERLIHPVNIHFNEAIVVAVGGLIINIISAVILGHGNADHHSHEHSHHSGHSHGHPHRDSNLKGAYIHVITDAMTSVLAILALLTAKFFNMNWMDPLVGILGAAVVSKWAFGLLKQTSSLLLDKGDFLQDILKIRAHIESDNASVEDIHVWQISENERSLILSVNARKFHPPAYYRDRVSEVARFDHVTVEVNVSQ